MRARYASCCVLSFNRPAFLSECVDTLLRHAHAPLQLIVHDDGSSAAGASQVLEHLVGLGATVIRNPPGHNEGQGVALNRMFAVASGDPIIKIDQDLQFLPGWLPTINRLMGAAPELGLLSGYRYDHDPCDWRKTLIRSRGEWDEHEYVMGSFMAIRRACHDDLGPFEERSPSFAEDHEYQRRVTASKRWVCGTPVEPLMTNQGYGIGPSTVVTAGGVQSIHREPRILCRT